MPDAKPQPHPKPVVYTLQSFAALVEKLRVAQKANGSGYKTPAGSAVAKPLENEVDAAITSIGKHRFPFDK